MVRYRIHRIGGLRHAKTNTTTKTRRTERNQKRICVSHPARNANHRGHRCNAGNYEDRQPRCMGMAAQKTYRKRNHTDTAIAGLQDRPSHHRNRRTISDILVRDITMSKKNIFVHAFCHELRTVMRDCLFALPLNILRTFSLKLFNWDFTGRNKLFVSARWNTLPVLSN